MNNKNNCVLITIDALRRDIFEDLFFNGHLAQMCGYKNDFVYFKNFFANGPNTYHSMPSIFASKYSSANGIGIRKYEKTLPYYFKKQGYTTIGFNQGNPWCSSIHGFNLHFDLFEDFVELSKKCIRKETTPPEKPKNSSGFFLEHVPPKLRYKIFRLLSKSRIKLKNPRKPSQVYERLIKLRKEFVTVLNEIIKDLPKLQPFFLWIHLMDTHSPYISTYSRDTKQCVRINAGLIHSKRFRKPGLELYRTAIMDVDNLIGDFLKSLKQQAVYDRTDVLITSDHGEAFHEHGEFGHSHYLCNEEVLKVPLLIKSTKNEQIQKYHNLFFSQIDLLPIMLSLTDNEIPSEDSILGRDVFSAGSDADGANHVISTSFQGKLEDDLFNVCKVYRTCRYKLKICEKYGIYELYNLDNDSNEKVNILRKQSSLTERLKKECLFELEKGRKINSRNMAAFHAVKATEALKFRFMK